MRWVGYKEESMSFERHEILPSGLKVDRHWWHTTKLVIAVVIGAVAAIMVHSVL